MFWPTCRWIPGALLLETINRTFKIDPAPCTTPLSSHNHFQNIKPSPTLDRTAYTNAGRRGGARGLTSYKLLRVGAENEKNRNAEKKKMDDRHISVDTSSIIFGPPLTACCAFLRDSTPCATPVQPTCGINETLHDG